MASMPDVISLHNSATVTHNVVPRFVLWGRGVTFDYRQESASNKRAGGWFFRSVMGKNSHVCLFFYADENTLEKKIYIIIIIMKGRKWDREKKRPSRVDETLIFGKYNEKKEREREMKNEKRLWNVKGMNERAIFNVNQNIEGKKWECDGPLSCRIIQEQNHRSMIFCSSDHFQDALIIHCFLLLHRRWTLPVFQLSSTYSNWPHSNVHFIL